MTHLELDEVRSTLTGVWDVTRARFWIGAAESAARKGEWETVARRLLNVADPLDAAFAAEAAWRQLTVAAFDAAIRASAGDLVTEVAGKMLDRAFGAHDDLADLRPVLGNAEEPDRLQAGATLAELLERRFPQSAWAAYARSHFDELLGRAAAASDPFDAGRIAVGFERAAELFDAGGDADAAAHCLLRAGVVWMTWTSRTDRARRLLRETSKSTMTPAASRWLALGWAHSPFWLDRVRAADWVGDALDRADRVSGATPEEEVRSAYAIADVLFSRLPVKLSDPERDRLETLLEEFDSETRWEYEAQLRGRDAARQAASMPLAEVDATAAAALEAESLPLDGFASLATAWAGRQTDDRPKSPIASLVIDLVSALAHGDEDAAGTSARALARAMADTPDSRDYRPVNLAILRACEADSDDRTFRDAITEVAVHYASRAPAPSYGFVPLATMLHGSGFGRAAAAATSRALEEGETAEASELDEAVARSVEWVVREGSDREMLVWLERARARFGA